MRLHSLRSVTALGIAMAMATVAAITVQGQAAAPAAKNSSTWKVPRTPDGKPDLQGNWSNNSVTPLERPRQWEGKKYLTDAELDQVSREVSTRYDFKGTDTTIDLQPTEIKLHSASEDRLAALRQVLEEKLVKRKVSLKALDYQKVEEASGATARQTVKLVAGISKEKATELNKHIKGLNLKGVQSQVQGEQLRVSGKKRDDLQTVIAALKEHDFGIPLQFGNFRD